MKKYIILTLFILLQLNAQDKEEKTATFFDDCAGKEYALSSIYVGGEVETPGEINLDSLPLRSFPYKEVESKENGKKRFIGSYFVTGYSLYDILSGIQLKKANKEEYPPLVDMYVIVENDSGDKTIFSWGEIFYSKDNFKSVIVKSVNPINPSKGKMEWPLNENCRLICGYDLTSDRAISNPTKITVKSAPGEYSKERLENIFSPEIKITKGETTVNFSQISETVKKVSFEHVGYGHGRGFKGINNIDGFLLKDVLSGMLELTSQDIQSGLVILSAKDGYRATYSLSEIINRNDQEDVLIMDFGDSESNGKFTSFTTADFFVDRNIRSVEKIDIITFQ